MEKIICSLLFPFLLASFAFYKKALTNMGVVVAFLCAVIITYCGGFTSFCILAVTFLATTIVGKIKKKMRESIVKGINQKHGTRDTVQVLANVGIGTFALLLYQATKNPIFLFSYACVMASSLADSIASELGVLSKQHPIDICTLKPILKGMSGGVTPLGLASSLLGSFLIAMIYYIGMDTSILSLWTITIFGFVGSLIDSILGSLFQVKYRCIACNQMTEKKQHCKRPTVYVKGIKFMNNDVVNFLNNLSVFVLTIIL